MKKKKPVKMSLQDFAQMDGGPPPEMEQSLPTAPRVRNEEEGFEGRGYGREDRSGGRGYGGYDRTLEREESIERAPPSRADSGPWSRGGSTLPDTSQERESGGGREQRNSGGYSRGYESRGYDNRGYQERTYQDRGHQERGYPRGYDRGYDRGGYDRGHDRGGYDRGYDRETEAPKERIPLNLTPRTKPVEPSKTQVSTSSIFGGARPREEVIKEKGLEDKEKSVEEKLSKTNSLEPSIDRVTEALPKMRVTDNVPKSNDRYGWGPSDREPLKRDDTGPRDYGNDRFGRDYPPRRDYPKDSEGSFRDFPQRRSGAYGDRPGYRKDEGGRDRDRGYGERGFSDRYGERGSNKGYGERGYSDRGYGERGYSDRGYSDRGSSDRASGDRGYGGRRSWRDDERRDSYGERDREDPTDEGRSQTRDQREKNRDLPSSSPREDDSQEKSPPSDL